jgi:outer membrane putative beta-barrel porin/alpha-amylase
VRVPRLPVLGFVACASALPPSPAAAQQPFVSDDAGVSDKGIWHVELSNQVDRLRASARPLIWQNLFESEVNLGLPGRLEASVIVPLLTLNAGEARRSVGGFGDSAVGLKVRFTRDPFARHAFAGSLTVEFPTGDRARELGSGLIDYKLNAISQHRLGRGWALVLNGGVLLAGDSSTGALGIRDRGTILTAAASLRTVRGRVHVGGEVTGAWSEAAVVAGSVIAVQTGANVWLARGCTLDVGGGTGWFEGSSRATFQVGLSVDLNPPRAGPPSPVAHGATPPTGARRGPRPALKGVWSDRRKKVESIQAFERRECG